MFVNSRAFPGDLQWRDSLYKEDKHVVACSPNDPVAFFNAACAGRCCYSTVQVGSPGCQPGNDSGRGLARGLSRAGDGRWATRDPAQEARSDGDQITPAIVALRKLLNFHFKKKNYLTSIDTCLRKRMVLASLVLGT